MSGAGKLDLGWGCLGGFASIEPPFTAQNSKVEIGVVVVSSHAASLSGLLLRLVRARAIAASLALLRFTMSVSWPFGSRTRYMPAQWRSGPTVASSRPVERRSR